MPDPPAQPDHAAASLLDRLAAEPRRLGRTRLVAIDGPAGSGKTTLAAALRRMGRSRGHNTAVVHLDDMYDGWETDFDELATRVRGQILAPFERGDPGRWQRYDWHLGRFGAWQLLDPPQLLVLEGCGSGARVLAPYTSLLVWLEADPDTRIRRGVERDGEQVLPLWLAWMDHEETHFVANDTRQRADIHFWT